jgi:hypothetical protein
LRDEAAAARAALTASEQRLRAALDELAPAVRAALSLASTTALLLGAGPEVAGLVAATTSVAAALDPDAPASVAEIDALVARLYDLTIPEFQHILTTFPLVDESVKSQTLHTYRELVKLGKFA